MNRSESAAKTVLSDLSLFRDLPYGAKAKVVAEYLQGYSYKPGYQFTVTDTKLGVKVLLEANVIDSRGGGGELLIELADYCHMDQVARGGLGYLERFMQTLVLNLEKHEIEEWLAWGGELLHDPHERQAGG